MIPRIWLQGRSPASRHLRVGDETGGL